MATEKNVTKKVKKLVLITCVYDPKRDIQPVSQCGYIDLAAANAANSIPSNLGVSELSYNEIEDPRSIGGRPGDVFDMAQAAKAITGYVPPKNEE